MPRDPDPSPAPERGVGCWAWNGSEWEVVVNDTDGHLQVDVLSGTITSVTKVALTFSAPTAASVGIVSAQALAANANRKGLFLVNTSTNYISIGLGSAAVLYSGITLSPSGGSFWMDEYSFTTSAVNAIASGAASNLAIQEMV